MPVEYDFMKSAKEKEMSDEEYKTLSDEYTKKANDMSNKLKKLLIALLVVFVLSLAALYVVGLLNSEANYGTGVGNYTWLIIEFLLLIFLYDPKAEEIKKHQYETDKKIIINSIKNRIQMIKIKLGLVIGFGAIFLFLNGFAWWSVYFYLTVPEGQGYELVRESVCAILNLM
jgi:cell division septal protein FtsQ